MSTAPSAYVEARRIEILDAAARVFVRRGMHAATMQDIAEEAGLSVGALYRYFDNKEDLVQAACRACDEEVHAIFEAANATGAEPIEHLRATGEIAWQMFEGPDAHAQAVMGLESLLAAARDPELDSLARRSPQSVIDGLQELVRQAQAAGQLTPELDARAMALTLLACHSGTRQLVALFGTAADPQGILRTLLMMVERLRPEGD